jgi:hypothetical protein
MVVVDWQMVQSKQSITPDRSIDRFNHVHTGASPPDVRMAILMVDDTGVGRSSYATALNVSN